MAPLPTALPAPDGEGTDVRGCALSSRLEGDLSLPEENSHQTLRRFSQASSCHISLCVPCPAVYFKPSTNTVLQQINAPIDQASI